MKRILLHCAFVVALVMSIQATAQEITPTNAGAYDALSPGNQMIVDALYNSQLASPNSLAGGLLLTNDDFAALKGGETGWGKAYQDLLAQGLVSHPNLGLAISSYQRQNNPAATPTIPTGQPTTAGIPTGTTTGIPANVPHRTGPVTSLDGFGDSGDPNGFGADGAAFGAEAAGFGKSDAGFGDGGSSFGAQGRTFGGNASGYGSEGAAFGTRGSGFGANGSSAGGGSGFSAGSSSIGSSAASSRAGNSGRRSSSSRGRR